MKKRQMAKRNLVQKPDSERKRVCAEKVGGNREGGSCKTRQFKLEVCCHRKAEVEADCFDSQD